MELSEQEIIRRQSLEELQKLGIDPYPAALFQINANTNEILEKFPNNPSLYQDVCLAGRIMTRRIMGNASFAEIQDSKGRSFFLWCPPNKGYSRINLIKYKSSR